MYKDEKPVGEVKFDWNGAWGTLARIVHVYADGTACTLTECGEVGHDRAPLEKLIETYGAALTDALAAATDHTKPGCDPEPEDSRHVREYNTSIGGKTITYTVATAADDGVDAHVDSTITVKWSEFTVRDEAWDVTIRPDEDGDAEIINWDNVSVFARDEALIKYLECKGYTVTK
jgi:hypothetical protein